jgi:hypothetical protein
MRVGIMGIRLKYSIPISLRTAIIIAVVVMGYMLGSVDI